MEQEKMELAVSQFHRKIWTMYLFCKVKEEEQKLTATLYRPAVDLEFTGHSRVMVIV